MHLVQEFERLHPRPCGHGVIAHDGIVGLRAQPLSELILGLNPIRGDSKIHPLQFVQAEFDIGFLIIDEENADFPPSVGRNAVCSLNWMLLKSLALAQKWHEKPPSGSPERAQDPPAR